MAAHEPVGTLAEEAAKLISVLQGWAGEHAASGDGAAESAHEAGHRLSTECRYCPLCNLGRVARAASPEVRDHLLSAALSMSLAVKGLLEGLERQRADGRPDADPRREPVEKIDLVED